MTKDEEIAQLTEERDRLRELVRDFCEDVDQFRKLAGAWDRSDSYGVEPLTEILERILMAYHDVMSQAVRFAEKMICAIVVQSKSHDEVESKESVKQAVAFLDSPEVQAWRKEQKC